MWQTDFEGLLRIRFFSHHTKCGQCLKHRLIIRKLGHCPPASRAQHALLQRHLQRQHCDRQVYWAARARSRLSATTVGTAEVSIILDSMDSQKHSWPRSTSMYSKEFASFQRPRLTSTSLIIHGHLTLLALSPHICSSNSSRTAEILCHGLTLLHRQRGMDLSGVFLHLQADNCSKEVKNNGTLRLCAMWVALHKIKGAEVSFLSSGHSHEDVDALFSLLRAHLEANKELWTPKDFRSCLEKFFENPGARPYEPLRSVILMTRFKDWKLNAHSHVIFSGFYPLKFGLSWKTICALLDSYFTWLSCSIILVPSFARSFRKNWLWHHFEFAQLTGVGGPGAPHVMRLERIGSSGLIS